MNHPFSGYRHILVATDFSAPAEAAVKQAGWVAQQSSAKITLAHTLRDLRRVIGSASTQAKTDFFEGEGKEFQREIRRESDEKMQQMVATLGAPAGNVECET